MKDLTENDFICLYSKLHVFQSQFPRPISDPHKSKTVPANLESPFSLWPFFKSSLTCFKSQKHH